MRLQELDSLKSQSSVRNAFGTITVSNNQINGSKARSLLFRVEHTTTRLPYG